MLQTLQRGHCLLAELYAAVNNVVVLSKAAAVEEASERLEPAAA